MWRQAPVIPATQEAEAGESLETGWGGGGRVCSELRSCCCTPAWETEQDSVSKKNKKQNRNSEGPEDEELSVSVCGGRAKMGMVGS